MSCWFWIEIITDEEITKRGWLIDEEIADKMITVLTQLLKKKAGDAP